MKIVLLGYYGFKNIGDDLMLMNLIEYLSCKSQVENITVYCKDNYYPEKPKIRYLTTRGIERFLLPMELFSADHVVWGGGTCLYDSADMSGMRWLRRQQRITSLGRGRFSFVGIGIGDLVSRESNELARAILEGTSFAYFREDTSLRLACETLSYRNEACVGGDLFLLNSERYAECAKVNRTGMLAAISFSGLYGLDESSAHLYGQLLSDIVERYGSTIHFLPAHQGDADDSVFHRKVASHLPEGAYVHHVWDSPGDYASILATMDFHIGMRLHSVVCADLLGIPNLAISYSPKVKLYVEKSGILPDVRVVPMNDPSIVERIIAISPSYRRPDEFLLAESTKARECLDKMFH